MREDKNCVLDDNLTFAIYIWFIFDVLNDICQISIINKIHTHVKKNRRNVQCKANAKFTAAVY